MTKKRRKRHSPEQIVKKLGDADAMNLCLDVGYGFKSEDVIERLVALSAKRGLPRFIRSDNGPEFIAGPLREWPGRDGFFQGIAPLAVTVLSKCGCSIRPPRSFEINLEPLPQPESHQGRILMIGTI